MVGEAGWYCWILEQLISLDSPFPVQPWVNIVDCNPRRLWNNGEVNIEKQARERKGLWRLRSVRVIVREWTSRSLWGPYSQKINLLLSPSHQFANLFMLLLAYSSKQWFISIGWPTRSNQFVGPNPILQLLVSVQLMSSAPLFGKDFLCFTDPGKGWLST